MTRKFWNWVRNEEPDSFGSERTLYLDGEISDETWYGDEVTPKLFKDELNAGDGNITLWINSPGGDVFAAAQIYNMLMDYKGNVTVKIDALAASAASVIAMAGTKVCMSPVAMLMIHNPATIAIGDTEEMQKAIDMLSEVKESIMNAYEIKSGLSRAKISKLMDAETWMNAKEARKLGFADEVLFAGGENPLPEENDTIEMLFSRKAVTDSLLSRLIPKKKPEADKHMVPVIDLEKRLSLLAHSRRLFIMTQIMELMDKRAKAWEAAKSFLNTHSQNGGMVSAEDAATYDKMEKEVTDFTHDIERLQRQEEIDKMLSAPTSAPLTGKPGAKNEPDDKPGIASKAYKAEFWNNIRKRNYYDVKDVLEIGTDANGGYLVPDE